MKKIILASGSKSRLSLLKRLRIDFEVCVPGIDETPRPQETIEQLVERLALEKAQAVRKTRPESLIVASDQAACVKGRILGKPADADAAHAQLKLCSGTAVRFHTSLCLLDAAISRQSISTVTTTVYFRQLAADEIRRYVERDTPFDCAGSFRSESLGITLFERIESEDPTALLGLPLMTLSAMLRHAGWELP